VVAAGDPRELGLKIAWLTAHPDEAIGMGRAGRRRVLEKFTWPQVVRRCLEVYSQRSVATGSVREAIAS
jgi:glycosyltransferase involved in cell wall biosynthesis